MRIAMISDFPPARSGTADYAEAYANALVTHGICVDHVPIKIESWNPLHYVRAALRARSADLVHVQYEGALYGRLQVNGKGVSALYTPLVYLCLLGMPVVTTVHEAVDPSRYPGWRGLPARLYYRLVYGSILRGSRSVLVHTGETARRLSHYGSADKVCVHLFPCFRDARGLPVSPHDAKWRLGATIRDSTVLLMYGHLVENKGHAIAIRALQDLPEECVLLIVGSPRNPREERYLDSLRELAKPLGDRVLFMSYVPDEDKPFMFGASDIVLLPYRDAGQSAVLHEALSYWKPIVTSDLPAFRSYALRGAVKLYKNDSALPQAILEALAMRDDLSKHAREAALADGIDLRVGELARLYGLRTLRGRLT